MGYGGTGDARAFLPRAAADGVGFCRASPQSGLDHMIRLDRLSCRTSSTRVTQMGFYPGNRTPLDPEAGKQMSNMHAGWNKAFGPRWIGTALRRLALGFRRSRSR
jgi:hypothetical protein